MLADGFFKQIPHVVAVAETEAGGFQLGGGVARTGVESMGREVLWRNHVIVDPEFICMRCRHFQYA